MITCTELIIIIHDNHIICVRCRMWPYHMGIACIGRNRVSLFTSHCLFQTQTVCENRGMVWVIHTRVDRLPRDFFNHIARSSIQSSFFLAKTLPKMDSLAQKLDVELSNPRCYDTTTSKIKSFVIVTEINSWTLDLSNKSTSTNLWNFLWKCQPF